MMAGSIDNDGDIRRNAIQFFAGGKALFVLKVILVPTLALQKTRLLPLYIGIPARLKPRIKLAQ